MLCAPGDLKLEQPLAKGIPVVPWYQPWLLEVCSAARIRT